MKDKKYYTKVFEEEETISSNKPSFINALPSSGCFWPIESIYNKEKEYY